MADATKTQNLNATYGKVTMAYVDYDTTHTINDYMKITLPESCVLIGKLSDDGLELGSLTSTGDSVFAADGSRVLTLDGDVEGEINASLLAVDNLETNKAVYGEDSVIDHVNGVLVRLKGKTPPARRFVFEVLKTGGRLERIVIVLGSVVQSDAQTLVYNEAVMLPITITPLADPTTGDYIWRLPVSAGESQGSKVGVNIVAPPSGEGTLQPVGLTLVDSGTDIKITAQPESGYELESWVVDDVETGRTDKELTLTGIGVPRTVSAKFAKTA